MQCELCGCMQHAQCLFTTKAVDGVCTSISWLDYKHQQTKFLIRVYIVDVT